MGMSPLSPEESIESRHSFLDSTVLQLSRFFCQIAECAPRAGDEFVLFDEKDFLPRKYAVRVSSAPNGLFPLTIYSTRWCYYEVEPFTESDIVSFLNKLQSRLQISKECFLATAVYLHRAQNSGLEIMPRNWRPVLLACLILSLKLWRDRPYLNSAVAITCELYSLRAINALELLMVKFLEWRLHIDSEEYRRLTNLVAIA